MTRETAPPRARLERLFTEHAGAVRRYAVLQVGADSADDVVAETFLVAWRRIGDVPDTPLPWLLGAARKASANHLRGRERRANLVIRLEGQANNQRATEPSNQVDERQRLAAALNQLSRRDQEALLAWAWYDLTAQEAARMLGCTKTAYSVRLHRARRRLQRQLADDQGAPDAVRVPKEEP